MGTRTIVVRASLAVALLPLFASSVAEAAEPGFALDRFEPSERGSRWFVLESLDLAGHGRPAAGVVASYQTRPLVARASDGVRAAVVDHVLTAHAGGAVNLWDRVRLAADLPLVLSTSGSEARVGTMVLAPPADAQSLGDLRLGADVRVAGEASSPITVAIGTQVWLPTGSPSSYTGDGVLRAAPRALVAGVAGPVAYAAKLGVMFRDPEAATFAGSPLGHELVYAVAAGVRLWDGRALVGPELFGATVLGDAAFKTRTSPLEAIMEAHVEVSHGVRAGAGIGTGLVSGYGAPGIRITGGIEWMMDAPAEAPPPAPVPGREDVDTDGDGIPDAADACMDVQGMRTSDPRTNGCADRDGDGILDPLDRCPFQAGPPNPDPAMHGCVPPPPPKEADADGDGIPDMADACPDASGGPSADAKKHGCPKILVQGDQIRSFTELPADEEAMQQILTILTEDSSITRLRVEGHTDNRGDPADNEKESLARAEAVTKWLVGRGVDASRVSAVGVGGERPIEANDTEEGRAANRRLELHIERQ